MRKSIKNEKLKVKNYGLFLVFIFKFIPKIIGISFCLTFLIFNCLEPAFESRPPGARPLGMSAAFVALSNDTNAPYYNPAGLRLIPEFEFSTTYNQLFSVEGLQYNVFSAAMPVEKLGVVGLSYSQFGPSEYKERTVILSNAFLLSEGLLFGYNLKTNFLKISEYGSDSATAVDLGILARISENFAIGSSAKNINEPVIGSDKIPEVFTVGIFLRPLKGINFGWDVEKTQDQSVSLHFGTEFRILEFFLIRSGVQTDPSRFSFGFGFNRKSLYFDYAYFTHPTMDADHVFSLSIKTSLEKEAAIEYKPKEKKAKKPRTTRKKAEEEPAVEETEAQQPSLKVNINTASVEELTTLPGIGAVMAKRIVDYRTEQEQFGSIEDLLKVPRMTRRIYDKIEGMVTVGR